MFSVWTGKIPVLTDLILLNHTISQGSDKWTSLLDIQFILTAGPANVTMVSNSGPHTPLHIHAPQGHIVQQVYDESSGISRFILRPQHPSMNQRGTGPSVSGHRIHHDGYSSSYLNVSD